MIMMVRRKLYQFIFIKIYLLNFMVLNFREMLIYQITMALIIGETIPEQKIKMEVIFQEFLRLPLVQVFIINGMH